MRPAIYVAIFAGLAAAPSLPSAAHAQLVRAYAGGGITRTPDRIAYARINELKGLRSRMLEQQKSDGGTLTQQHWVAFQNELDRINAFYEKSLANNDPLTVNADGSAARGVDVHQDWTYSKPVQTGIVP